MRGSRLLIGLGVLVLLGLAAALLLLPGAPEAGSTRPGPGATGPRPKAPVAAAPRAVEPAPSAPQAVTGAAAPVEPAPTPAPAPEGDAVSLRGVKGVVVDAVTGAPIEGAWVGWRALNQELLASTQRSDGTLSGKDGRFALPRPGDAETPAPLLRAVAPGRAPAAVAAGLADEVRIELHLAGSLKVTVTGGDGAVVGLRAVSTGRDVDRAFAEEDEPDGKGEPPVFRFQRLAPGTWAVELDRVERARVAIEPGRETALELSAPERWPVVVQLTGSPPEAAGTVRELQLVRGHGDAETRCSLPSAGEGRFAGSPRPGPHRLLAILGTGAPAPVPDQSTVELGRIEGPGEHRVAFPSLLSVRIEVDPPASGLLVLLGLEQEHLFLAEPGEASALAPARYALYRETAFLNRTPPLFLGELDLRGAPPVVRVAPRLVPASLGFALPEGLLPTEALRARFALVPACLAPAAHRVDHLDRQVLIPAADPRVDLGPILPGRYLVRGTSDLGPFEATLELPGETVIDLR